MLYEFVNGDYVLFTTANSEFEAFNNIKNAVTEYGIDYPQFGWIIKRSFNSIVSIVNETPIPLNVYIK